MDIQRNTEERSCNHNCCGKAISIVHSRGGGYAVAQLFTVLRYKPEGRGLDSRWGHRIFFHLIKPSGPTIVPEGRFSLYHK